MTLLKLKTFKWNDILVCCLLNIVCDAWRNREEVSHWRKSLCEIAVQFISPVVSFYNKYGSSFVTDGDPIKAMKSSPLLGPF